MAFSPSLVITQQDLIDPNLPRICWINYVTTTNISATSQTDLNPASNMANPSTAFAWQADSALEQQIEITIGGAQVDYLGIARHNLEGTAEVKVELLSDEVYVTIFDWATVDNRQSLLFLFNEASPDAVRFSIRNAVASPRIAVMYCGISTMVERSIYVGHTPITMGRNKTEIGGVSQSGQYLGSNVTTEYYSTSANLENLTPEWYRQNLDPFINRSNPTPFFWSWRPDKYPEETAFCWLSGSAKPVNQRSNGMMQISLSMEGII